MPLYDYDCASCGRRFEVIHGVHADGPTVCPLCGKGPVRKALSAPAVHFKGSGWAKKERRASTTKAASSGSTSGDGGEPASTSATENTTASTATKAEPKAAAGETD